MVKLRGWQRLWLVAAVLYLLAVALFAMSNYPKAETTLHRTEFYERMGKESVSVLTAALDSKDIVRVTMPNGHEIPFAADTPKEKMQFISRQYYEIVGEQAATERGSFFGLTFLWWMLPVLAMYAIGAAIGWVYRGFKAS